MANFIRYNLTRIGENFKVNLCVSVKHNETGSYRNKVKSYSSISKSNKGYTSYYDVNLYPYIEIDFTSFDDIKESLYSGVSISNACKITLNKYNIFLFITMLKKMEKDFIVNKDLYYYTNGKLVLNTDKAKEISVDTIINDVKVMIIPTVIQVGGGEREHEGIALSLRDLSNTAYLTYTEMGYLRFILENIDIDSLAINLVKLVGENTVHTTVNNVVISSDTVGNTVPQIEEPDNSSSGNIIIKAENVIPKI